MHVTLRRSLMIRFLAGIAAIILLWAMWGCGTKPVLTPSQEPSTPQAPVSDPAVLTAARVKELASEAAMLMESGNLEKAFSKYNQALALNPDTAQTREIMNRIDQLLAGASSDLIQAFLETSGLAVPEPLIHYWLGVNLAQETAYAQSLTVLTQFLDRWPDHPRIPDARELVAMLQQTLFKKDTIGCLLPLSGKYALYGEKALKGIQLAVQDLAQTHGRKFNLVIKDTRGDPDTAVKCVEELDQARVAGIVGPLLAVDTAGARAQELKIPLIALTQKEDFAMSGEYLFSNFITPRMQVQTLAAYVFRTLGLKKAAILYPDEPYGRRHMQLFSEAVTEYGAQLVGMQAYDGTSTDFTVSIQKLTDQLSRSSASDTIAFDVEALFIPDAASRINMILPQLAFNDVRDIVLLGTNLWHDSSLPDQTRGYNRNAIITDGYFEYSRKPATARFTQAFSRLYGESPGFLEAIFYDTVQIMLSTAQESSVDSRHRLKEALLEERIFEGATGRTLFEPTGAARKELFLITIKNDRFVELDR